MTAGEGAGGEGVDAFARLSPGVRAALSERGFATPTEPQRRAIPPIAAGRNALVVAPTGTGKTETAMLPVLSAVDEAEDRFGIAVLYVTPLRALNRDMRDRLEWWGDELGLDVDVRHGDTSDYRRSKQADDPPDVLVTTPETLQAMLTGSKLRRALADVAHVVVDEVHELAASKRGAQLTVGLERLREVAGGFQRVGLSATVGDPEEVGAFLTGARGCAVVEVDAGSRFEVEVVAPEVTPEDERLAGELATDPELAAHVRTIRDVVRANESTLVFVNTRSTAEALAARFRALDEPIGVHHGSLAREARLDAEAAFKAGDLDGLVCTSSMELGIDVGRVDHVVQYNSPREVARLLQRVGRAGHRRDRVSRGTVVTDDPDDRLEALAVARRALDGAVEPAQIHEGSLDVVANQVAGLVMDEGEVSARRAYEVVTRAYPFRDLGEEPFRQVVRELSGNRVVWLDEEADRLEKGGGTWQYFYANLSMIPDETTFGVYDVSSQSTVGSLDERFVVNFADPGSTFVHGGRMWRVANVDEEEERVEVSPVGDPAGEVPSWVGREIPVPAAVANDVGALRARAADRLRAPEADADAVAAALADEFPTDRATLAGALEPVARQVEAGDAVPTADRLVVEGRGREVVLNSPHGHEVNETLGRLVAALLGQRTGSSVGMEVDPYRVELEVPRGVGPPDVASVLEETDPEHVAALLELALKRSDALKFALVDVATTFGRLDRDTGDRMGADRLMAALEDTPVFDEAVRQVFHDDLDVAGTAALLRRVRSGAVEVVVERGSTPLGTAGRSGGREFLVPENADAGVIDTVRERIMDDGVVLVCLHCADWTRRTKVKRVPEDPECPACGATRVAALSPYDDDTLQAVESGDRSDEQESLVERAHRNANLVQAHGKRAVVALRARGVGPQTAARIIGKLRESEDEFYRDLLEREREYARTRSFWD
jgi:ATP-dependent Lhr-like helicase